MPVCELLSLRAPILGLVFVIEGQDPPSAGQFAVSRPQRRSDIAEPPISARRDDLTELLGTCVVAGTGQQILANCKGHV